MGLISKLAGNFSTEDKDLGRTNYLEQRVKLRRGSERSVEASVKGWSSYSVLLAWRGEKLRTFCNCPDGAKHGNPCWHLWAVILAADAEGHLAAVIDSPGLEHIPATGFAAADFQDEEELLPVADTPTPKPSSSLFEMSIEAEPEEPSPWKKELLELRRHNPWTAPKATAWPQKRQLLYCVDVSRTLSSRGVALRFASRDRQKEGEFTAPRFIALEYAQLESFAAADDCEVLALLGGAKDCQGYINTQGTMPNPLLIPPLLARTVMSRIVQTERCYLFFAENDEIRGPLKWEELPAWQLTLKLVHAGVDLWQMRGVLRRQEQSMDLEQAVLLTAGGFLFFDERVSAFSCDEDTAAWLGFFRNKRAMEIPNAELDEFLSLLLQQPNLPSLELPDEFQDGEAATSPRVHLRLSPPGAKEKIEGVKATLSFQYEDKFCNQGTGPKGFYIASTRRFLRRNSEAEGRAVQLLKELGGRYQASRSDEQWSWELPVSRVGEIVRTLLQEEWYVEADGKPYRKPGDFRIDITSEVDWFELRGELTFEESSVSVPELLAALEQGDHTVRLGDGSYGILPEEWLERIGIVLSMGEVTDGHVRFHRNQAGLLDALLAAQPKAACDETFTRLREELRSFDGIVSVSQPTGFQGQLRDYQCEGLAWMHFLRKFSFGGCLADDMGVGKTAQVLALLETRRELRSSGAVSEPSLVVVPKSLIFNWKQESARFAPKLRLLDYTGASRDRSELASYDVVLTTYGTLRRDAQHFKDIRFDYIILDEAQAIKNSGTDSAKAARLLRGTNRLAMSGTPVENHLGELWSLFEFLNPGMLGSAKALSLIDAAMRNPNGDTSKFLAQALRPFLLRRTKEQVARELPEKSEQTIYCELSEQQQELYDDLRRHYRTSLLDKVEKDGLEKSKIQVLEALLRLRQVACHPGLIDAKYADSSSAKVEVLLDQLEEICQEGHKALVFSQFTSLLALVRSRLDARGLIHEYLDGKTQDRQAKVEHFQQDPQCKLFLISLKAGGVGLNLTAADYVFILDPWWNPAVEAQAVDRAHRIGQTRKVCAYRLIAKDTIEEKILDLQQSKRELASAIIGEENSLIRNLCREDLELLLS